MLKCEAPMITPNEPSNKPKLLLQPQLPQLCLDDPIAFFEQITTGLVSLRSEIHQAVIKCLDNLVASGNIASYRDHSERYSSWQYSCYVEDPENGRRLWDLDNLRFLDLKCKGFINCIFLNFEITILNTSSVASPEHIRKYTVSPSFISVPKPWVVYLSHWSKRQLKTMGKIRFGIWLRLEFPIYVTLDPPRQATCNHRFQIHPLGVWEWRLLWECRLCGYLCHCKCFEKAIRAKPLTVSDVQRYQNSIPVPLNAIPFTENACDVCRGVPSTNEFCHEMYARSIFEQRHGAYVEKRLVEMGVDQGSKEYDHIRRAVTNQVRQELGFKAIGERFVTETELFRILVSLFPEEHVIHHHRGDWLQGLELDIYVPSRRLGVEYHGKQHFEAVAAWGGSEALAKTQERDAKKALLCEENGVNLVVFTCEENISLSLVRNRLTAAGLCT